MEKEERIKQIQQRFDEIIELAKKYKVTPYEIGKNTIVSTTGAQKILGRDIKTPNINRLNSIYEYILRTYEPENYKQLFNKSIEDEEGIIEILNRIEQRLEANAIKIDIIFEILKNTFNKEYLHLSKENNNVNKTNSVS